MNILINIVAPDKMAHCVASHLGLHCCYNQKSKKEGKDQESIQSSTTPSENKKI